jgi:hypothetical protein
MGVVTGYGLEFDSRQDQEIFSNLQRPELLGSSFSGSTAIRALN